jgi:hypothetical protein
MRNLVTQTSAPATCIVVPTSQLSVSWFPQGLVKPHLIVGAARYENAPKVVAFQVDGSDLGNRLWEC